MSNNYNTPAGEMPRVTGILGLLDKSSALIPWGVNLACEYIKGQFDQGGEFGADVIHEVAERAKKEWRNVSAEAMDIGSEIHALIEKYIKEGRDALGEMRPEVENGFLAFLEWEKENIDEWIESELTVYDPVACYAGTLDAVARLKDGRTVVIDFKSSKGFYDGYDMQIAAYKNAYEINNKCQVDGGLCVRLDKETGLPEHKDYSKVLDDKLKAFLHLVDFYYAYKNRRCKNARTMGEKAPF